LHQKYDFIPSFLTSLISCFQFNFPSHSILTLFSGTAAQLVSFKGESKIICIPVVVAVSCSVDFASEFRTMIICNLGGDVVYQVNLWRLVC
jgi:hypothetical protein